MSTAVLALAIVVCVNCVFTTTTLVGIGPDRDIDDDLLETLSRRLLSATRERVREMPVVSCGASSDRPSDIEVKIR